MQKVVLYYVCKIYFYKLVNNMENNLSVDIVSNIKAFFGELDNFERQFQYISVTISDYLKEKYKDAYQMLVIVESLALKDVFCKRNKISEEKVNDFMKTYAHIGDVIDAHNQNSTTKKAIQSRTNLVSVTSYDIAKVIVDACQDISKKYFYGITMLINVLKGNRPKALVESGFEKSVYFGALKDIKTSNVAKLIDILVAEGTLLRSEGMYPVLSVNTQFDLKNLSRDTKEKIDAVLKSNFKFGKRQRKVSKDGEITAKFEGFDVLVNEDGEVETDLELLKELRETRKQLANERNLSAYLVCSNKVLVRLATFKPKTAEEFLTVKGVGEKWYENNGEEFLKVILQAQNNEK